MKKMNYASGFALSTVLLLGICFGPQALAEEKREVNTPGTVYFAPNDSEEIEVIPPVDPPVWIPPIDGPNTGPLTIAYAPTLDFGDQVNSNVDRDYNLVAERWQLDEDPIIFMPYVSFVQVSDTRGTNAGWNLRVSLSQFESSTQNNVLRGAEIKFNDGEVVYHGSSENMPQHTRHMVLRPDTGSQVVMNAPRGRGAGASSVFWGDQHQLGADFEAGVRTVENPYIQLFVPGSTLKDQTTYEATLTWTLSSVPGEEIPGDEPSEEAL